MRRRGVFIRDLAHVRHGDNEALAADVDGFAVPQEAVADLLLMFGQGRGDVSADDVHIRAALEQPARGVEIARGDGAVAEGAGVFVNAGEHQRGIEGAGVDVPLHEFLNQDRRTGAEGLDDLSLALGQEVAVLMMIDDDDFGVIRDSFVGCEHLRIHQPNARNSAARGSVPGAERIGESFEESRQVSVAPFRQDGNSFGIEQPGR